MWRRDLVQVGQEVHEEVVDDVSLVALPHGVEVQPRLLHSFIFRIRVYILSTV